MNCVKLPLASGVIGVVFDENWTYDNETPERNHRMLAQQFAQFASVRSTGVATQVPAV
jgi:hypothetical protein